MARGLHIDHQLTRDAVKNTIKKIIYYEDFPYSSKFEDVDSFISENKLKRYIWAGDFEMKRKAIFMYGTQTESFIAFGNGTLELTPENFYST